MNTGTALYDYEATDSDQLSLSSGQRVRVREHLEGGWSYGEVLGSGEYGHFPTEYVQLDEPDVDSSSAVSFSTVASAQRSPSMKTAQQIGQGLTSSVRED